MKALTVALFVLLLPVVGFGQGFTWTTETVDTSGTFSSIAVDQAGNVHVSYFSGGVKYAFRAENSSRWYSMQIAPSSGYTGIPTRVSLDPQGNPHICFTPGTLRYASFDGHRWKTDQIDPESGLIEYTCSLGFAAEGTPHLSWYQYGSFDGGYYLHVKHADLRDGVWQARTLDYEGQTGKWNSLVVDSEGNPHVAYDSFLKYELKYASYNGKEWKTSIVDSPDIDPSGGYRGMGNSLVLDREGKARISYNSVDSLKYAWQGDSSWKIETVDHVTLNGGWAGYRTRQALDSQGYPHIAYQDASSLKHAYWDGSGWKIERISRPGPYADRYQDIAIDRDGNIYISFQDSEDGSLKVAIGRPTTASALHLETTKN